MRSARLPARSAGYFNLPGVQVARVREDRSGLLAHTVVLKMLEGSVQNRFQVPGVGGVKGDLDGEDDGALVHPSRALCACRDSGIRLLG
jgi:hypothetical protein